MSSRRQYVRLQRAARLLDTTPEAVLIATCRVAKVCQDSAVSIPKTEVEELMRRKKESEEFFD